MPDLNLSLSYFNHRKTKRLIAILGRDADVLPIRLWAYCGDAHPENGELRGYTADEIESFIGWKGKAGKAIESLVSVGWLEPIEGGYKVHDWEEHQGHLAAFKIRGKAAALARWQKARSCLKHTTSIATSMPQGMLHQCSDGLTVPTDGTIKKQEPRAAEFAVEPPPGMPEDEERAGFIGERAGVPKERAIAYWNELASRGWRDSRGNQIFDFGRHTKTRYDYEVNRKAEHASAKPAQRPTSIMDMRNVIEAKKTLAQSIRNKYASETASDTVWSSKEKRGEYFKLKKEISELTKKIATSL